jgi:hypothetical protein
MAFSSAAKPFTAMALKKTPHTIPDFIKTSLKIQQPYSKTWLALK